ncbi:MAG TPA: hypothetical protein VGQ83_22540, partial [Polyangia bacterium]
MPRTPVARRCSRCPRPGRARALLAAFALTVALAAHARADAPAPITPGPEGRRAFDDLTRHYRGQGKPPFEAALKDLASADGPRRERAGRYLLALFMQAFADDQSGRGPCRRTPFFGGGSVCDARELRRELSQAFAARASGPAALDAALWLVTEEKVAESQAAGMHVIGRVESPRVTEVLRGLLAPPHPNEEVLRQAIALGGARRLAGLAPALRALCHSPRPAVRAAVVKAAPAVGLQLGGGCPAPTTLSPFWEAELRAIAEMVLTKVPPAARWMRFTHTDPSSRVGGKPVVVEVHGWLLGEEPEAYRALDRFARERTLPKKATTARAGSLAEEAKDLLAARAPGRRDVSEALSERGGLTGQFQPRFISLPEALVAAWALARSDGPVAAALLVPRIAETRDDRWIRWAVRDLLGHQYHQEMLEAFSLERDYGRAARLARHLG